jgi:putative protease
MIDHIPDLLKAGVNSLKIEGRMKTALYVASVGRAYRQAIDDYLESEELYQSRIPQYMDAIKKCTYRRFTTGFYYGKPDQDSMVYDSNTYVNEAVFLGIVEAITPENRARIMQRNKFCVGDRIEVMKPDGRDIPILVKAMYNQNGEEVDSAPHPKEIIDLELVLEEDMSVSADVEEGDLLRVVMDPA